MPANLFPILMIGAVIVLGFFMSRKQKRQVAAQQQMRDSIVVGTRVMTTSGLYATVSSVDDAETIELEIAPGVLTTWARAAVRDVVVPASDEVVGQEAADATEATDSPAGLDRRSGDLN